MLQERATLLYYNQATPLKIGVFKKLRKRKSQFFPFCDSLRHDLLAFRVLEQVVIALRIKRRVEIDKVNRLISDVLPQHLQIIAVVKLVHSLLM